MHYLRERVTPQHSVASAEVIFGELIGNVVRHSPGPIDVCVDWEGLHPVLHVLDRGEGKIGEGHLPRDLMSENGRGLFIIKSLSKRMSVEHIEGYGNHVSVVLPFERTS